MEPQPGPCQGHDPRYHRNEGIPPDGPRQLSMDTTILNAAITGNQVALNILADQEVMQETSETASKLDKFGKI